MRSMFVAMFVALGLAGCGDDDKRHAGFTRNEAEAGMTDLYTRPANGPNCPAKVVEKARCEPVRDFWRCRATFKGGGSTTDEISKNRNIIKFIC